MSLNLHRVGIVLGCLASGTGFMLSATSGCGSNNSSTSPEEGGTDATTDSSGDVSIVETSALDATDAAIGVDTGVDSAAIDANTTVTDSSDFADVGDVQVTAPALGDFPHALDVAYCTRLQECCLVPPAQWNQAGATGCVTLFDSYGGAFRIGSYSQALDSGLVTYSPASAVKCLTEMLSFNCGTLNVAGINQVSADCYAAVSGTLGVGAGPCTNSMECNAGEYCRLGDAGTGICVAVGSVGQPCSDTTFSTDCTYLGNGNPAQFCEPGDAGVATCQSARPEDAGCKLNQWCQSELCAINDTCTDLYAFSDPGVPNGTCALFTILDAGGD